MRIIHFSDPHVSAFPDSFRALFDKRILGTANYFLRRRFLHDETMLSKAVEFILTDPPDAVVCAGDITSTGSPREFRTALKILAPLLELPATKFLYVPGNHDAYVADKRCAAALEESFAKLNGNGLALPDLPVKVPVGECDFALINEGCPTNPFLSTGVARKEDAEKIAEFAENKNGRPLILLGHLPLRYKSSLWGKRHDLRGPGREILEQLLDKGKIDLSLCGHKHINRRNVDESGRGEIGAGAITRTGDINIIDYSPDKDIFDITTADIRMTGVGSAL